MSSMKPFGRLDTRRTIARNVVEVGGCTECKQTVFSDQEHVRVRRPTIGLNHSWCVPAGAVVAK